ncbi:RsmD family RNA methyltransferase [Patescibacteria group bacterium]|nr:RsmD family RNA methyltransferase [Patescibacteria group bacterium]
MLAPWFHLEPAWSDNSDTASSRQTVRRGGSRGASSGDIQIFSGDEWNYRNRMDMTFTDSGIGFREKGKWWKVLPISECTISNHRLNELNKEVCDFFGPEYDAFNVKSHEGIYKYAVIRTPQNDSSISIVLNKQSPRLDEATAKVKEFAKKTSANNVLITYIKAKSSQSIGEEYEVVKGSDMLEETIMGKTLRYSAQGFFQNNSIMAEKMHEYVHDLIKSHKPNEYASLLDLYGGVGAFGIVNADLFKSVTSVESFEGCTVAAKDNIKLNKIKNMEAICMDAKRLKQVNLPPANLYIITDPPRSGMSQETIIELKKLKPELIIYISCNIEQLGKDLPKFREYKIKSAAIFDLFPQTNHMESVIELVAK